VDQKRFAPTTSIFDSVALPWALVGLMFVMAGSATYWLALPS